MGRRYVPEVLTRTEARAEHAIRSDPYREKTERTLREELATCLARQNVSRMRGETFHLRRLEAEEARITAELRRRRIAACV